VTARAGSPASRYTLARATTASNPLRARAPARRRAPPRRWPPRTRPVEARRERQRAPGELATLEVDRRIGHERPRLVEELVHLLVDGAAAALGHEGRPLGDRALEVREVAPELAHVAGRCCLP
jgi:hypothetical protein